MTVTKVRGIPPHIVIISKPAATEPDQLEESVINNLTERLYTAASNVNRYAGTSELYRNRVNYESAAHTAQLLNLFGCGARVEAFVNNHYVLIPKVVINGKTTEFYLPKKVTCMRAEAQ